MKRLSFAILPLALALAACADPAVRVVQPAPERLQCAAEPAVPGIEGEPVTDAQDSAYKRDLRAAWFDCHSAVDWLRDWFAGQE